MLAVRLPRCQWDLNVKPGDALTHMDQFRVSMSTFEFTTLGPPTVFGGTRAEGERRIERSA